MLLLLLRYSILCDNFYLDDCYTVTMVGVANRYDTGNIRLLLSSTSAIRIDAAVGLMF